jgi:hypothetical protein
LNCSFQSHWLWAKTLELDINVFDVDGFQIMWHDSIFSKIPTHDQFEFVRSEMWDRAP